MSPIDKHKKTWVIENDGIAVHHLFPECLFYKKNKTVDGRTYISVACKAEPGNICALCETKLSLQFSSL